MHEKTILSMVNETFDNAVKNSRLKKNIRKIAFFWKKSFFAAIARFKPKKYFYFSEEKGKKIFLHSRVLEFIVKIANAILSFIEKKTFFPKWLVEKAAEKKLVLAGIMILIAALSYLFKIFLTGTVQKDSYIAALLLLVSFLFIGLGVVFEKHKKNSFFCNFAKNFWDQTKV